MELQGRSYSPAATSWKKFRCVRGGDRGEWAWGRSWAQDGASAVPLVGCSAAGRPAHGGAGSRRRGGKQAVALGFGAAATGWRDEGAGVGDLIYRAAGILGVRA
jgi:hypothetical protein